MSDFFEFMMCVFMIFMTICYAFSPISMGDWRNEIWELSFEGNVVNDEVIFFDDGKEKTVSVDDHQGTTMFLNDDLEAVSSENATLKIVFLCGDRFVVYD